MIDTKTLTCSNCHGGDFIRLDDNEFKCTHCGSITIVQDDVAKRLEQILLKLQTPATATPVIVSRRPVIGVIIIVAFLILLPMLMHLINGMGTHHSSPRALPAARADVDPGLLKVENLKLVEDGDKLVGMIRNDSDRVVRRVELTLNVYDDKLRKGDESGTLYNRLLPGESLPIEFWPWRNKVGDRVEVANKQVDTDDDFGGRAELRLAHQQLIREDTSLRFIGQLTDVDTVPAKSINVSITLFDVNENLLAAGHGSPESSELARGETTNFEVSISRYRDGDVDSMRYLIDSERVTAGASR